jgi:radical SAM-linked protein
MSDELFIFHPSAFTHFINLPPATAAAGKHFEHMVRLRVRVRFSKRDDLRWIGHRDLMRLFERIFRRAALPLGRSEGFHPKPRMTFPLPLAVGIAGACEVMEFELAETLSAEEIAARLAPQLPGGLQLHSVEVLPEGAKKVRVISASYEAPIPAPLTSGLAERIDRLLAQPACPIARSHGRKAVDIRPLLESLALSAGALSMRLRIDQAGSAGPREVLQALGLGDLESQGVALERTAVEIAP